MARLLTSLLTAQMSNLRMQSALPLGFQRGKLQRNDDNLGGGRLSRRAADPAVEAERRAQQDRHYALDPDRVERGWLLWLSLLRGLIPA